MKRIKTNEKSRQRNKAVKSALRTHVRRFREAADAGETEITGSMPINCSGGVLSSNPIGASGMIRFAEAALQVRGQAGAHQIDGARVAVGHAYGGAAQYYAMWVVSADKP